MSRQALIFCIAFAFVNAQGCGEEDDNGQNGPPQILIEMQGIYDLVEQDGEEVCTVSDSNACGGDQDCWFQQCGYYQVGTVVMEIKASDQSLTWDKFHWSGELDEHMLCGLEIEDVSARLGEKVSHLQAAIVEEDPQIEHT